MADEGVRFGTIRLSGGRYERAGLPLVGAAELARYERLVGAVARELFLRAHPKRLRGPRGFGENLGLRLVAVEEGSVVPVLERRLSGADDALFPVDWYEDARLLINDALRDLASPQARLNPRFPIACLKEFASFGRSLSDAETIEFSSAGEDPASFTQQTRRKIQALAELDELEVELQLQGQIIGLRSRPQQFDFVPVSTDRRVTGAYLEPAMWDQLRRHQGFADRAPLVALSVVATQDPSGALLTIHDVLGVEAALPRDWAERIQYLSRLRRGWIENADAPSPLSLDVAEQILLACVDEGVPRPGIFASENGGVQLEWSTTDDELEISIDDAGVVRGLWYSKTADEENSRTFEAMDIDDILNFIGGDRGA